MEAHGNLDRDRLQWLANNPHYQNEPWRFVHCVKSGNCALCGQFLGEYDAKWHHADGRMICTKHWRNMTPPTDKWMFYTDG